MKMLSQAKNILKQASNPKRLPILISKIYQRITDKEQSSRLRENMAFLEKHEEDFATLAQSLDNALWAEALQYSDKLEAESKAKLADLGVTLGGGGFYTLIYFLTRYLKPEYTVETGVAAGFSSHAFLSAIELNGEGKLFSSDFPYFRLDEPEKYIGILVPESLRKYWSLFIDGDAINLPKIIESVPKVDLFHYDSDKRYAGREKAMEIVSPKLADNAVVVMDDINDNCFFMDYCNSSQKPFRVFKFKGKHIGLVGALN